MVDRDVALRKSEAIEHHAACLRAKLPLDPAALSARLARAAGLRNLIVHRYADLDAAKLAQAIAGGFGDLEEFAAALRRRAGLAPQPPRPG